MLPEPLAQLSPAALARAEARLRTRELKPGERLLREGDACRSLLFVERGPLRVFKTAEGEKVVSVERISEPEETDAEDGDEGAETPEA